MRFAAGLSVWAGAVCAGAVCADPEASPSEPSLASQEPAGDETAPVRHDENRQVLLNEMMGNTRVQLESSDGNEPVRSGLHQRLRVLRAPHGVCRLNFDGFAFSGCVLSRPQHRPQSLHAHPCRVVFLELECLSSLPDQPLHQLSVFELTGRG